MSSSLTSCLRSSARGASAASAVVVHDERFRDQALSCAWRTSRVQGSHARVCLRLVGLVESPPPSNEQPIVAGVMTPSSYTVTALSSSCSSSASGLRTPPRFLVVAVVTASWLGA